VAGHAACVMVPLRQMPRTSPTYPQCHAGQIPRPGPNGSPVLTHVWICEYPYRTTRAHGPSNDCGDCPVWCDMQRNRRRTDPQQTDEIERLEHQLTV
jgi:hypothetical protein